MAVRKMLAESSVDCMMARDRLMYAQRVLANGPDSLSALLWNTGAPLSWATQIKNDVVNMQNVIGNEFLRDLDPWTALCECPEDTWRQCVNRLFWDTSSADPSVELLAPQAEMNVHCSACAQDGVAKSFVSGKALQAHQRIKHNARSPMRFFRTEFRRLPVVQYEL